MEGWFSYKGVTTSQNPKVEGVLRDFLRSVRPVRVIEIGTFCGGLTLMLRDLLNELHMNDTLIYTYDPEKEPDIFKQGPIEGITYSNVNMFSYSYDKLADYSIVELVTLPGRTVIFCDGGSKKNEFRILSPHLKTGDIILAHDYAPNQEYFETHMKDKIWNWMEISDEHINGPCGENGLTPFWQEQFINVAWCSRIKQ